MATTELSVKSVKELRNIAKEMNITGRWDMNRTQLIYAIERSQLISEAKDLGIKTAAMLNNDQIKKVIEAEKNIMVVEEKPSHKKRGAKKRKIEVYKDGKLIQTIDGLMETFNWVTENKITNVGWVKRSLKTGEETAAGYKYREGGYLFKYAN
ncbi:Rho termination factor N-terminal domain-containing protein [Bacillus sp. LJBS06]|uniref:Rho termination factor N-terminal domain-containing protein n=1 Tax=Bacillus sp. LJBS06 TaxID=2809036 RepID=UPI001967D1AB|nr:Rho termination factor N-terminal domain-containing protein [Bacillus sp. LJBS06]QRZ95027.1 Rho termination factor N-terminal domain-containing protein [Bacillus sp. LJBS06]